MALDRSVNVRLPMDLLHRLESKVSAVNDSRAKSHSAWDGNEFGTFTISEVIRRTLEVGLDVIDGDREKIDRWFLEHYWDEMKAVLASGYSDKRAEKILKMLAKKANAEKDELDFG